jgi:hypothetical protein
MFVSKTRSWKKAAAPAIAKRDASKIIIFIIFMLINQMVVEFESK